MCEPFSEPPSGSFCISRPSLTMQIHSRKGGLQFQTDCQLPGETVVKDTPRLVFTVQISMCDNSNSSGRKSSIARLDLRPERAALITRIARHVPACIARIIAGYSGNAITLDMVFSTAKRAVAASSFTCGCRADACMTEHFEFKDDGDALVCVFQPHSTTSRIPRRHIYNYSFALQPQLHTPAPDPVGFLRLDMFEQPLLDYFSFEVGGPDPSIRNVRMTVDRGVRDWSLLPMMADSVPNCRTIYIDQNYGAEMQMQELKEAIELMPDLESVCVDDFQSRGITPDSLDEWRGIIPAGRDFMYAERLRNGGDGSSVTKTVTCVNGDLSMDFARPFPAA